MTERRPPLRCMICGRPMADVTGAAPGTLNCQECGDIYRRMIDGFRASLGERPVKEGQ